MRLGFLLVEILLPMRRGFYIWRSVAPLAPPMPAALEFVPAIHWLSTVADQGLLVYLQAYTLMAYSRSPTLWMIYYLVQPLLDVALFAAAGLAAASKVRGSGGLAAAVGLSGGLAGSGYAFTRLTTQALMLGYWRLVEHSTRRLRLMPGLDLSHPALKPGLLIANLWLTGIPVVLPAPTRPITHIVIVLTLIAKAGLVWLMAGGGKASGRGG
jgi:hypothetical protein